MKQLLRTKVVAAVALVMLALAVTACEVERTGNNSVEISTDTTETREAEQRTETAASEVREETRDAVQATETALREGARQTGTALEKAGQELQQHSKPGNQP